jgi:amino acid permease
VVESPSNLGNYDHSICICSRIGVLDMKSILRLPEVYIIGVLLLFFSHVLIRWRKESRKSNLLFVAFVTIITAQFFLLAPIMNSKILLDAFKADTVQFKSESIDVSADIGKVFSNEFGGKN